MSGRTIKTEAILESKKISGLSPTANRIFYRLILLADEDGDYKSTTKKIDPSVDQIEIDIALQELDSVKLIAISGNTALSILNFKKWVEL